jgi:hypothetical protein
MKTIIPKVLLMAVACSLLAACATPYQPAGFRGGFKEEQIRDNLWYLTFGGNAWIDYGTAVKYFHRRAKELCTEQGFRDYTVRESRDGTEHTAVVNPGSAMIMQKPVHSGYVECV